MNSNKMSIRKKKLSDLSEAGREELALAILLWKDFKSNGKLDVKVMQQAVEFCCMLGVEKEFSKSLSSLSPMHVIERKY